MSALSHPLDPPQLSALLVSSIAARPGELAILCGAGVSASAGVPLATEDQPGLPSVVAHATARLLRAARGSSDAVADPMTWAREQGWYIGSQPNSDYYEAVHRVGRDGRARSRYLRSVLANAIAPTEIHRIVASLAWRRHIGTVFTTNFDDLLERAFVEDPSGADGEAFALVTMDTDAKAALLLGRVLPALVKLHGSYLYRAPTPPEFVPRILPPQRRAWLEAAVAEGGLLVLGYSGSEPGVMSALDAGLRRRRSMPSGVIWAVPHTDGLGRAARQMLEGDLGRDGRIVLAVVDDPARMLREVVDAIEARHPTVLTEAAHRPSSCGEQRVPLLGRTHERALGKALLSSPAGVVIQGPPGVGKSALARALVADVRGDAEDVIWWDCNGADTVDALKSAIAARQNAGSRRRAGARQGTAGGRPGLLVVLDNFESQVNVATQSFASEQWVGVLRALHANSDSRVIVTTTDWRPPAVVRDLHVLPIAGLGRDAGCELLSRLSAGAMPKALAETVVRRLDGNPWALGTFAASWAPTQSATSLGTGAGVRAAYESLVRGIMARLSTAERRALETATVLSGPMPTTTLAELGIRPDVVESLVARSLLHENENGGLRLPSLVAQAIEGLLNPRKRTDAHRRARDHFGRAADESVRRRVADRDAVATAQFGEYVLHCVFTATDAESASCWRDYTWINEVLASTGSVEQQAILARAVRTALAEPAIADTASPEALCSAGTVLHENGDTADGLSLCLRGLALAEATGDSAREVDCVLIAGECLLDHGRAPDVLRRFARLEADPAVATGSPRFAMRHGKAFYRSGKLDDALRCYLAARAGDASLDVHERIALGGFLSNVLADGDRAEEAHAEALAALRLARAGHNRREMATQMVNLALACRRLRRTAEAREYLEGAAVLYDEVGYLRGLGTTRRIQANASRGQGHLELAQREIDESLGYHRAANYRRGEATSCGVAAEIAADLGALDQALVLTARAVAIARELGDARTLSINLVDLGRRWRALDPAAEDEATNALLEAAALAEEGGFERIRKRALAALAEPVADAPTTSRKAADPSRDAAPPPAPIVLVVTTEVEEEAVYRTLRRAGLREHVYDPETGRTHVGTTAAGREVSVLRLVRMGSTRAGASLLSVHDAVRMLAKPTIILVGIAFGVDEERQQVGEVLVAEHLLTYEQQRIGTTDEGQLDVQYRGERVDAHPRPLRAFHANVASRRKRSYGVSFGTILTGEKLIDNLDYRKSLQQMASGIVGGEMEAAGVYSAASYSGAEWACVKAICDFADGDKGTDKAERQKVAARNAATFVVQTLSLL